MRDVVGIEIRGKLRDIEWSTRVRLNNKFWKPKLSRTDPKGAELKPKQMRGEGLKAWEAEQGERPHGDEQKDQEHGPRYINVEFVSVTTPSPQKLDFMISISNSGSSGCSVATKTMARIQ